MVTGDVLILCAAGMLVTAYLVVPQKALFTAIRLFALQSLLLAIVAATIAVLRGATRAPRDGGPHSRAEDDPDPVVPDARDRPDWDSPGD